MAFTGLFQPIHFEEMRFVQPSFAETLSSWPLPPGCSVKREDYEELAKPCQCGLQRSEAFSSSLWEGSQAAPNPFRNHENAAVTTPNAPKSTRS
jgi:hypothetical protein